MSKSRKIIKTFTVIIASLIILAVAAVLAMRFVVLPKISQKLQSSGRGELAALVDQNNNFGSFAMFGKLFADKGMIEFVTTIDGKSASSMIDLMETIDGENPSEPTPTPVPQDTIKTPWKVEEVRHIPRSTPEPKPTSAPVIPTPPPSTQKQAASAYDRIAAVASSQEMADGLAIISKLDMGYVASLVADGLTPTEKNELKTYVYSKLTKAEIKRALELYNKYKKYL